MRLQNNNIPVTFQHEGKMHKGFFSNVAGAGSAAMFHLSVDGYYWGRLRFSDFSNSWVFDSHSKSAGVEKLTDEFGDLIIAWYQ